MQVLRVGSRDQRVLNREGDNLRIDWGYFYLAVPDQPGASLATANNAIQSFLSSGNVAEVDDMDMPQRPRHRAAHLAVAFHAQTSAAGPVSRHVDPRIRRELLHRISQPQAAPLLASKRSNGGRHVGRVRGSVS
jgi:hypothetical protein